MKLVKCVSIYKVVEFLLEVVQFIDDEVVVEILFNFDGNLFVECFG